MCFFNILFSFLDNFPFLKKVCNIIRHRIICKKQSWLIKILNWRLQAWVFLFLYIRQLKHTLFAHLILHLINKLKIIFEIPWLFVESLSVSLRLCDFKSFVKATVSSLSTLAELYVSTCQHFSKSLEFFIPLFIECHHLLLHVFTKLLFLQFRFVCFFWLRIFNSFNYRSCHFWHYLHASFFSFFKNYFFGNFPFS